MQRDFTNPGYIFGKRTFPPLDISPLGHFPPSKMTTRTYPPYLLTDIGHSPPLAIEVVREPDRHRRHSFTSQFTEHLNRGVFREGAFAPAPWEANIFVIIFNVEKYDKFWKLENVHLKCTPVPPGLYLDSAQLNPAQLISAQIITTVVKRLKE